MNMKRCVIIETRTRWSVDIPDDVPDSEKVKYAWKRLLLLGDRIPKAGKKDLQVQFFPPWDLHDVLIHETDTEAGEHEHTERKKKLQDTSDQGAV